MRRISIFFIVFLIVVFTLLISSCLIFSNAFAEDVRTPIIESNVYIYDQDNVIDDEVEKRLNSLLVELEEKTSVEFVVISVRSLQGMRIEDYSIEVANKLGIGKKSSDNGILLLFTKSEKDLGPSTRLEIGSGMEGILNDAKCGRILDQHFVPYRDKDEYTQAVDFTVRAIISILSKEYNVSILSDEETIVEEDKEVLSWGTLPLPIKIFIILMIIVFMFIAIIALIDDDYGGGSFGSYRGSSSGGFGGSFGGGSFHGGGASR